MFVVYITTNSNPYKKETKKKPTHNNKTCLRYQKKMTDSILHDHHINAIESKSDEPEYDFAEYYSKEKTLALRDIYIPYVNKDKKTFLLL